MLKLFGKDADRVVTTVGPEQEYFLVRKKDYEKRQDLVCTGRTLFGAALSKGQELDEHYFGAIRPSVIRLHEGVGRGAVEAGRYSPRPSTTRLPRAQHELAPIFDHYQRAPSTTTC